MKAPTELRAIVQGLACHPELWADEVRHDPLERVFVPIARTAETEVWLVCWLPGHDTGFHDHDDSAAAITVVSGAVRDERLAMGGTPIATEHGAGECFTVDPGGIHRVRHAGDAPAVTLHAYSPPLGRMGTYHVTGDGRLLRLPQDGDDELRAEADAPVPGRG